MNGVEFDLSKITADEMGEFFAAAKTNDNKTLATVLTKVVKVCPAEWGDPSRAETFGRLPYFETFKALISAFVDEAQGKN